MFLQINNLQSQDKQIDCDFLISCLNDKIIEYGDGMFLDLKNGILIYSIDNYHSETKTDYYKQFLKGSFTAKDKSEYLLFLTFMSDEFTHVGNLGTCEAFLLDENFKQIKGPVELIYRVFTQSDDWCGKIKPPTKIDINSDGIDEFYFEDVYGNKGRLWKLVNIYTGNLKDLIRYQIYYSDKETLRNKFINYNSTYKFVDSKVIFNSTVEKYLVISDIENRLAFKGEYLDEFILKDGELEYIYDKRNINFDDFEME